MNNKINIMFSQDDLFRILEKSKRSPEFEITVDMNQHRLITLTFPIKCKDDLRLLTRFCRNLGDAFNRFVNRLKDRYEVKDNLRR